MSALTKVRKKFTGCEAYPAFRSMPGRVRLFTACLFFCAHLLALLLCTGVPSCRAADEACSATLKERIGQMIMVGFRGLAVDDETPVITDIRAGRVGGVILFDYDVPAGRPVRNIVSPEQLRTLTRDLQKAAPIPLFVALDQEGGRVNRLKERFGFPPTVSQRFLGDRDDLELTWRYAERTAQTLAAVGVNVNFAPVVDLDVNPDNPVISGLERSFSADPAVVTRHARTMIETFHRFGILSAVKHFPGHGSSRGDSHKVFVNVTATWSPLELIPFRTLVEDGLCDMVMTAHIFNEKLDPRWPATLSTKVVGGILREDMQFQGVVVSDDLQMEAIRSFYETGVVIRRAIEAGCDILLFANNSIYEEDIAARAQRLIAEMVDRGEITPERIDRSFLRIQRLKERLGTAP